MDTENHNLPEHKPTGRNQHEEIKQASEQESDVAEMLELSNQ